MNARIAYYWSSLWYRRSRCSSDCAGVVSMIPDERLQELIRGKDQERASRWCNEHRYVEAWAIVDGCLIIYDADDCPTWIAEKLQSRDDDGNTSAYHNPDERQAA